MKIDQTVKTFDEFQKFRLQWQEDTFQMFTITKSDMFSVAEKERETLVYKKVIYGCAHGTQRTAVCFALRQKVSDTQFSHKQMRGSLFGCLENQRLTQFSGPDGKEKVNYWQR